MGEFKYKIEPDFDYTIDEKNNTFIALRKITWGDSDTPKLDLRKYYAREDGETMSKGVSFLTDEGPNELTRVLLDTGYGNSREIANSILDNRPDIGSLIYQSVEDNPGYIDMWSEYLAANGIEDDYSPDDLLKDDDYE